VKKTSRTLASLAACLLLAGAGLRAQEKPPIIPLKVQIVISRYQGERKVSSLPYMLAVNANLNKTSLRLGSQLPIVSTSYTPANAENKDARPLQSYNYRDIGTNIDCSAHTLPDGRFQLDIALDDSSVYSTDRAERTPVLIGNVPSFVSFKSTNSVILKDGQSMQYTTATDKTTGEVTKVDVTLTVLK
jgi:Bacterial type II and III secretion system protein